MQLLLQAGAAVVAKDSLWRTPLHYAAQNPQAHPHAYQAVELLLQWAAKPNVLDDVGFSPLHCSAYIPTGA